MRSASSRKELEAAVWMGPSGDNPYYAQPSELPTVSKDHDWFQYRVLLTTPDGGSTPVLQDVRIDVR